MRSEPLVGKDPAIAPVMAEIENALRPQPSEPWPAAGASPF
jgi:hypothetical protein